MSNPVPEKLINFRVYLDGTDLLGNSDVELPNLEAMTDTVKGAGVAGEVDSPVLGHYGSMSLTMNWRVITGNTTILAKPQAHQLDLRGSVQVYDASDGKYLTKALKVVVKAVPKNTQLGKLDVGAAQEAVSEFEVNYIKVLVDGTEKIEIDKYNFICKIEGEDYLQSVRENLGL
ncbi:MAG: phage major tail tube protein [Synergistales bacterium]|nr:phage major tail tube protein [Synergistales bacterium]